MVNGRSNGQEHITHQDQHLEYTREGKRQGGERKRLAQKQDVSCNAKMQQ